MHLNRISSLHCTPKNPKHQSELPKPGTEPTEIRTSKRVYPDHQRRSSLRGKTPQGLVRVSDDYRVPGLGQGLGAFTGRSIWLSSFYTVISRFGDLLFRGDEDFTPQEDLA